MNRLAIVVLAGSLAIVPCMAQAEARIPSGSAGEVTLDWQKFNELWTKMQQMEKQIHDFENPDVRPPVPFTITKAAYKGTVGTKRIDMTAVFELDVYDAKEWSKIPFLPASVAITEAKLDGVPVGVLQEAGFHQIVLKKAGRHVLRVAFALKAPKAEESPQFFLSVKETPMTLLALEFARPQLDVTIEPSQGVESQSAGKDKTLVTAALPPTSQIQVRWQKAVAEEVAGPAKLYLESQQLITVAEGTLKSHWNLNYSILRKGVRELRLRVPEEWNILAVNAEGIQEWKVDTHAKTPELVIQLAYARRGNVSISIQAEKGLGEKDTVIEAPRLVPLQVEREQGTVGIETKGAVELAVQSADGLHTIDPKELPSTVWQAAGQPILLAFRYTKPYSLALTVTRHPEVAVLSTTIDDANGITVLTSRGQLITKVRYQVRNQLKQYLSVKLPPGSELWSAFVAGEPVKPMQAVDGSYRIPLTKSQLNGQGQQGFPVEMIFYRAVPKFLPVGYRALTLPMPDAPVSQMVWSVYLPEKYRFPYFGGDVEKGDLATPWKALRGEAIMSQFQPAVAAPMNMEQDKKRSRRDLDSLTAKMSGHLGYGGAKVDEIAERQSELADSLFVARKVAPTVAGILPVAFELPTAGQMFHFGQVMVVGEDPKVTLMFLHQRIIHGIFWILIALAGRLIYRKRDWLSVHIRALAQKIAAILPARRAAAL